MSKTDLSDEYFNDDTFCSHCRLCPKDKKELYKFPRCDDCGRIICEGYWVYFAKHFYCQRCVRVLRKNLIEKLKRPDP